MNTRVTEAFIIAERPSRKVGEKAILSPDVELAARGTKF